MSRQGKYLSENGQKCLLWGKKGRIWDKHFFLVGSKTFGTFTSEHPLTPCLHWFFCRIWHLWARVLRTWARLIGISPFCKPPRPHLTRKFKMFCYRKISNKIIHVNTRNTRSTINTSYTSYTRKHNNRRGAVHLLRNTNCGSQEPPPM